jgi:hypothetical protein
VTATATPTWPQEETLTDIRQAGNVYCDAIEAARAAYSSLLDPTEAPSVKKGVDNPTYADVGVLAQTIEIIALNVEEIQDDLARMRKCLVSAAIEARGQTA